jgi:predicted transcriptional regulator
MGTDAQVAGAHLGSFNTQSVKLGSDLYGSVLPAAESFINSIQMQGASMKLLIPIVATTAAKTLAMTGQNQDAKLAMVDLINGALGPGTVSLKTLNKWVGDNSTSQQNFAKDVYTSMANASNLAGVLNKNLIPMMNQAFIQATNLAPAMKTWFTDVINGTSGTAAGQRDRANLVRDIINAGNAAHDTKGQIEQMIAQVLNIPLKKAIQIYMETSGSGQIIITGTGINQRTINTTTGQVRAFGGHTAKGGYVGVGTTPTADDVLLMASKGELVVPEWLVKSGAVNHLRGKIPGFAGGGMVGAVINAEGQVGRAEADFGASAVQAFALSALSAERAEAARELARAKAQAAATAAAGLNNLPLGTGPHSGSAAIAQAFARSILFAYGWGMNQWPYEQALWNQESGWNAYAANPTSNARGIPQNINGWSAYAPGDYQAQIRWGDAYIFARYGTPANAWAHEKAYNWYDTGGWIKPGMNHMYNGTGKMEHLTNDTNSSGGTLQVAPGGASAFEQFMVMAIREWVVRKGGGSVQKAFGIPGK